MANQRQTKHPVALLMLTCILLAGDPAAARVADPYVYQVIDVPDAESTFAFGDQ